MFPTKFFWPAKEDDRNQLKEAYDGRPVFAPFVSISTLAEPPDATRDPVGVRTKGSNKVVSIIAWRGDPLGYLRPSLFAGGALP